jgi:hypothetical protein
MQDIMQGGGVKISSGAVHGLCVGRLLAEGLHQMRGASPCVRSRCHLGPKVSAVLASLLSLGTPSQHGEEGKV